MQALRFTAFAAAILLATPSLADRALSSPAYLAAEQAALGSPKPVASSRDTKSR